MEYLPNMCETLDLTLQHGINWSQYLQIQHLRGSAKRIKSQGNVQLLSEFKVQLRCVGPCLKRKDRDRENMSSLHLEQYISVWKADVLFF